MAFNNGNFGNTNNAPTEKKSWRIGKDLYTSDAKFSVGLYESGYKTPFCSLQIITSIGKDPTTGNVAYEQRPPQEIPSILINHEMLEALIDRFTDKTRPTKDRDFFPNWIEPTTINATFDCGHNAKLSISGSATGVKIKVSNDKGEREGSITGVQLDSGTNFAGWRILLQKMYYVLAYMSSAGIDAEKFSTAMKSTSGGITMTPTENIVPDDLPI